MKTEHLDNEIERLILMESTKDLSEYGQDMLNEFRAIKQALTIPVVVGRSEQFKCGMKESKTGKKCETQCKECKEIYGYCSI